MLRLLYKALENPQIYNLTQKILGGERVYGVLQDIVKKTIEGIQYRTVLDVGCGTGFFKNCFDGEYTGIDINHNYIRTAGTKRNGHFLVANATVLPFGTETFDIVFTLGLIHHVNTQNQIKVLCEMWRVCKKGGNILIIDGLVPSNRLNILGYTLAKLDRGRFKIRFMEFKKIITFAYPDASCVRYTDIRLFPYEYIVALVKKPV